MTTTVAPLLPDAHWQEVIRSNQARQRRLMSLATDPCPDCGACSEEFKRSCIKSECAQREQIA